MIERRNSKNSKNNTPVRKSKTHLKLPQLERFTEAAKRRQSLAAETVKPMHKISELELHEVSSRSYTTSSIDLSAVNISNPMGTQDTEPNSNKLQDEAPAEL